MEGLFQLQEEGNNVLLPSCGQADLENFAVVLLAGPETEGQVEASRQCQATLNPCDQSLLECSLDSMLNSTLSVPGLDVLIM